MPVRSNWLAGLLWIWLASWMSCQEPVAEQRPGAPAPGPTHDWSVPLIPSVATGDTVLAVLALSSDGATLYAACYAEGDTTHGGVLFLVDEAGSVIDRVTLVGDNFSGASGLDFGQDGLFLSNSIPLARLTRGNAPAFGDFVAQFESADRTWTAKPRSRDLKGTQIAFDGETFTTADTHALSKVLYGEWGLVEYGYQGLTTYRDASRFKSSVMLEQVSAGPMGHWLTGGYYGPMIFDADTVLPPPSARVMGFIAARDLFGSTLWARQLGGTIPGKPRNWGDTRSLDMLPDPLGYVWLLWEGRPLDPSADKEILGVNLYDPNGVLLKNFILNLRLPGGAEPTLQIIQEGQLAVTSQGIAEDGRPARQILVMDREGSILSDTLLRFQDNENCLKGFISRDHFYYVCEEDVPSVSGAQRAILLRKKRFR